MRRVPSTLLRLGLGVIWHKSSYADAAQIFGLPDTDSNHASAAGLASYGSGDIHSPSPSKTLHHDTAAMTSGPTKLGNAGLTSSALLDVRQQEPVTNTPDATDVCTRSSTIYVGQASCLPFVVDATSSWVCVTSTSTSVGCNIGGDTISTTHLSTTSVSARCAQTGCAACLPLNDTPPAPVTVDCKNCSTTGGLLFAAPITTLPPDVNSGQAVATASSTQSAASDPASATESTTQPAVSDPAAATDSTTQAAVSDPAMPTESNTQPAISDPAMATGSTTQPAISDPAIATDSTSQPLVSDPSSTAPAVLGGRGVESEVAPAAQSKLRGFIRAIRNFPRSLRRYVFNLNMKDIGAPGITAYETLSPSAVPSQPTRTLETRSLLQPQDYPGGHDEFMVKEVEQAANVDMLVWHRPPNTGGRSSAKVKGFRTNGFNLAVDKLNACNSVIVVSRKGGYISHILGSANDDG